MREVKYLSFIEKLDWDTDSARHNRNLCLDDPRLISGKHRRLGERGEMLAAEQTVFYQSREQFCTDRAEIRLVFKPNPSHQFTLVSASLSLASDKLKVPMNVSATVSVFKLLIRPSLCIPHATVSTFDQVPNPVSEALAEANGGKKPDIRAVVLDKDNCFAIPRENSVHKPYAVCILCDFIQ